MSMTESERTKLRRRRLLKSAAAVPAIFVLPAGAEVANSSLNACVARGFPPGTQTPANPIPATSHDQWVRSFQPAGPNDNPPAGNYLQFVDGKPVATASCWNSVHPGGPFADGQNLIR
ncbi:MAG: hypothetical protein AW11_01601 [Candidatus Accumulibacter regalis]|jgi:hypothetical protein|uniref:Uncharacterized protein n=1 Tax=Accumulibacter regalis TaxID=522306 RepID=A0A011P2T0_ACCRE|nr:MULTISPECIES: hypothetical protein [unclassified Candidatus Accumulibacter]EXI89278.1 MAG: hypothetical protein AW11_01601 [Candidatus Accumulibacter regalis]MBL8369285.1 hypothetical protein [Accumulibacter sp.]MBN8513710.1 hypothetical protein [Accumulibacter sp.]MBO3701214.1 hypothetical protein [Accumulibacter sp.]HRE69290.1 hypothetical protein [Accumulibacter sp.]